MGQGEAPIPRPIERRVDRVADVIRLLGPGILLAAPILYAALGGMFTQRAGIFNIALEGFMLLAAYFAVAVAVSTGSLMWGTLAGVLAAVLAAAVMAVLVVGCRADEVIVGIAINVFALGLTTFLLAETLSTGRRLELPTGYPTLHVSWLTGVPVLGPVFNDRDVLIWGLLPAVAGVAYVFRNTGFGLRLKAAGEAPLAARAAGVRVAGVRFVSIAISGAFCGLGGAELAIGSVHLFSENITSGRGIIAFAAVIFGAGFVGRTAAACLLFGFAQALAGLLQIRTDFPSQFVLMVPYVLTIVAIVARDALAKRGRARGSRARPEPTYAAAQRSVGQVVVAGHLTVDEIRLPDGRALPETFGGAAAYAALGAFLAQGDVLVAARVGEDYPIDRLRMEHADGGVIRTDGIVVTPGRSIHNVAHYRADGARNFEIEDFRALVDQTPRAADLEQLDVGDRWVLVAPMTLAQQAELIATLKARGARVALDTELHYLGEPDALEELRKLTRSVDCFLPSREHLQQLCGVAADAGAEELRAAVELFAAPLTIVKCGRQGAVVFSPEHPAGSVAPAVPGLPVADPTGAGDGFNGAFLVALARGEPPQEAALAGCVAASFVVQAVGAQVPDTFSAAERNARTAQCAHPPFRDHREARIV